jgi:hypothetical protein
MLHIPSRTQPSPVEKVALTRLAISSDLCPPPHLREELQAKGWVRITKTGEPRLTGLGRELVDRY